MDFLELFWLNPKKNLVGKVHTKDIQLWNSGEANEKHKKVRKKENKKGFSFNINFSRALNKQLKKCF